ncbi:Bifunctional purine biosynthesis protein PurH [Coemansia erecta]|uniref:Bifunctional purine biosynthesis protein PurH n=1 Tax=Coemansia erecta TaxID=147472 RepID=A0A9W8CP11_9FUNG|nr:Bifunctional purine biosynthesis protein PurH [Coemansia erecta]
MAVSTDSPNIPEDIIKKCSEGPAVKINGLPTCLPMGSTMWGLIVGMVALGALTGSLAAGRAADRFGRKRVLLVNNIFFVIGALLLGTSTTVAQLAIGRYVSGIGCGVASTVVATYNSECAPINARGLLGTILQLSVEVGIFLSQLIAIFLVDVPNWRILFGLSAAISVVQLVLLPFMPESPRYLVTNGKFSEAFRALQFLRPHHNVSNEYSNLLESVSVSATTSTTSTSTTNNNTPANCQPAQSEDGFMPDSASGYNIPISDKSDKKPSVSIRSEEHTTSPSSFGLIDIAKGRTPDVIWHMLFCTMFLMGFQQWTGAKGIVFYSTEILDKVFDLGDAQLSHTPNVAQW